MTVAVIVTVIASVLGQFLLRVPDGSGRLITSDKVPETEGEYDGTQPG